MLRGRSLENCHCTVTYQAVGHVCSWLCVFCCYLTVFAVQTTPMYHTQTEPGPHSFPWSSARVSHHAVRCWLAMASTGGCTARICSQAPLLTAAWLRSPFFCLLSVGDPTPTGHSEVLSTWLYLLNSTKIKQTGSVFIAVNFFRIYVSDQWTLF